MPPYGGKYKAAPYGCGLFTLVGDIIKELRQVPLFLLDTSYAILYNGSSKKSLK